MTAGYAGIAVAGAGKVSQDVLRPTASGALDLLSLHPEH